EMPEVPRAIPVSSSSMPWPDAGVRRRDPSFCFNHQSQPSQLACADCNEKFCRDCVVTLQGRTWGGPCKNFRLRVAQSPPRLAVSAVLAPIVAMIGAPIGLVLG